jgi:UDP-3-O-[3-hydroxymyristoyl] N-acetylglucosamine deacetylase
MRTFESEIKFSGVGIHSGNIVNITIKPSARHGIFFKRSDMKEAGLIAAKYDNVGEYNLRNTTVGDISGANVQTIEHLMAALFIVGVDSAVIEIDGSETPILDGSAKEFYERLSKVGITSGNMKKIVIKKEIVVKKSEILRQMQFFKRLMVVAHDWIMGRRNNGFARLSPADGGLCVRATMDYPDKIIGVQTFEYLFDGSAKSVKKFAGDIASARTFGRYSEWEYLKSRGMGRGADKSNVIALNDKGNSTLTPLFWPDEFVRHQIIDILGDMFTSGGFIIGHYESYKGGHAMNNLILKKLFSNPSNYDIIE